MRNKKLRLWCIVLAVTMLLVTLPVTAMAASAEGISTAAELQNMEKDGNYVLLNDINGADLETIPEFSGTLNGNGYSISNLAQPLFGLLDEATVTNLSLDKVQIEGTFALAEGASDIKLGALAQEISYSTVDGVQVSGTVDVTLTDDHLVGGLCGFASRSIISNCSFDGDLTVDATDAENSYVGGMAGSTWVQDAPGVFLRCTTAGSIESTGAEKAFLGGITGSFTAVGWDKGSITSCATTMSIAGSADEMKAAGMAGKADYQSEIVGCLSSANIDVTGKEDCLAGGIVGYGELNLSIQNCYVKDGSYSASVTDEAKTAYAGGVAAVLWGSGNGIIYVNNCVVQGNTYDADYAGDVSGSAGHNSGYTNCYYDGEAAFGVEDGNVDQTDVAVKTDDELTASDTYENWDNFDQYWDLSDGSLSLNVAKETVPYGTILVHKDATNTGALFEAEGYTAIVGATAFDSMADALKAVRPGFTIVLCSDVTETEAMVVTDDLTILGNGNTITADECVGFYIQDDLNSFTVRDLTLEGVLPVGEKAGEGGSGSFMGIGTYNDCCGVQDLELTNVTIDGFSYGLYFGKNPAGGNGPYNENDVCLDAQNLTVQNCYIKGAYFEKLTDSTFTDCSFLDNGADPARVQDGFQTWMCGVDLNLKNGQYENISFEGCTFEGNGANNGTALHIKARDDGKYGSDTSLSGVFVTGCTFEDNNDKGVNYGPIVLGEADKDNATPVNVHIQPDVHVTNNLDEDDVVCVTFDSKGGSEVSSLYVEAGSKIELPKPSKKGYTFLGWKSSADREVYKAEATVKIDEDTTFTAQWMSNWEIVDDVAGAAGSGKEFFTDVKPGDWYYDAVKFVFDNNFMDGVGDGKFNPDGTLTRAMIAQVLYNLEGETSSYPTVFDDVAKSAWYADAVNWAAASGIVEGKGNNKFDPNAAITRQEMAAILYRYSELKGYDVSDVDSLAAFTDADKVASWAKEPMGWAVENYVINGKGNGKLDPTGTATRAEVAQILMNLCNNVL